MSKDTILLVEDDVWIARLLDVYLSERGYRVVSVSRGQQALDYCRETPPDLIVLDIRLPDMTGYDVGIALRADPQTQNIPIVVLTAYSEKQDRMTALDVVQADYFLPKPFDIEEVHAIIRNQLSDNRRKGHYHPITNLPTGDLVNEQLRAMLSNEGWTLALIRINGFESFTQLYGVVVGENVLKFSALLLLDAVRTHDGADDFVGQMIVGAYFLIVSTPDRIERITRDLSQRFDKDIKLHYDYRDRIEGKFSPMSLSVAVLSSADGPFRDIRELTEVAESRLHTQRSQSRP
ncbi:response regulator [Candidatus Gracilibacteria bacterium]|nr:response regulator [Candidatus Gracilibacteria bacterium]